jgi:hypothetical protein
MWAGALPWGEPRRVALARADAGTYDPESRRVVEYVNAEIERWNAGRRDEPIDLIMQAASERLKRVDRR